MSYPGRNRNKGVALVTALLVVSIATTAAIGLSARLQLDIRRTANLIDGDQAWLYAMGAEAWSEAILARDLKDNKFDGLQDTWAKKLPPIELPGGGMIGVIDDMQGRFNINNLKTKGEKHDATAVTRFKSLLTVLELKPNLDQAVIDWLDKDIEATPPDGAEDDHYLGLKTPYLAANRKMENISELRLIKGFDQAVYERIAPFVTALPVRTTINVNTAPAEVLASLSPAISLELAKKLVEERNKKPYEKLSDFTEHEALKNSTQNKNGQLKDIDIKSDFFMLHIDVRIANARASLDSLIRRNKDKLEVLQRSQRLLRINAPTDRHSKDRQEKS
jgi:general secretion pathway protein K